MHTHFGSATTGFAAFLSVLVFGTVWRLGWMHAMSFGIKRKINWLRRLAGAALFQY